MAPPAGLGVLIARVPPALRAVTVVLVAAGLPGCGRAADRLAPAFEWHVIPAPPAVGPATLVVAIRDQAGRPVTGATLRLEAHMTHPGMAPALADAVERSPGRYETTVHFSMAGDWVVLLKGRLPDGSPIDHRIDVGPVHPSP